MCMQYLQNLKKYQKLYFVKINQILKEWATNFSSVKDRSSDAHAQGLFPPS